MDHLNKLVLKELVVGWPNIYFEKIQLYDAYQKGKKLSTPLNRKKMLFLQICIYNS